MTLPINFNLVGLNLNLTCMCMGIPEGRVRSMGGSHMGKVMSDYFKIKINGSDHGQKYFRWGLI